LAQRRKIASPIGVIAKAQRAIVPSLHDVLRYVDEIQTRWSSHLRIVRVAACRAYG